MSIHGASGSPEQEGIFQIPDFMPNMEETPPSVVRILELVPTLLPKQLRRRELRVQLSEESLSAQRQDIILSEMLSIASLIEEELTVAGVVGSDDQTRFTGFLDLLCREAEISHAAQIYKAIGLDSD